MDRIKHRTWDAAAKAGEWKEESRKKGKLLDNEEGWNGAGLCELELKIRMEVGLIGNMEEKKDREKLNFKIGNDTKGQSRITDGLKVKSVHGEITSEETSQKEVQAVNVIRKLPAREESVSQLDVSEYLVLLKALRINLPKGVLNPKVILLSQNADIIEKAQNVVKDLESFKLQFNSIPRLGCRKVKNSLALKNNGNVLEMTLMIFFRKSKDSEKTLRAKWSENTSNTVCRFGFRHKYKTTAISAPALYATRQTRSWKHLQVGVNVPNISKGVTVNIKTIEEKEYRSESTLSPTSQNFGNFFQNPADEIECLKFFHELGEIGRDQNLSYTRNTKVEFGFLSGKLDFLADITDNANAKGAERDKILIECKGTTGDMVGKLFTKPNNDSRRAQLDETHEYCCQIQAYMYILNKSAEQTQGFTSNRAVMVIRHYHKNGENPRDFYWNFLEKNETVQQQIDELCAFCQEEVLACFLAVLNLIFQLEI
ncbi:uncharacterized protein LOC130432615 [Triplophysa dalaica]|uniref:uncharacterized protein LOC130432615 n=1 Tax=Triplophysa dalaica TaxID=1582913 RepID=UPI0024E00B3E|nr:uncharacterized protein LOC130432615 [Triplophysa dalaica]XP_056618046.1 uncharacterized protein LOC130432615 [Triplophysa dalaica]